MTRSDISPEGFQAAAVANAMDMVAMWHAVVRMARRLAADDLDVAADKLVNGACQALNDLAGYQVVYRDKVLAWLYAESRKGNGFHGTYDCGRGHSDRYYWMVQAEDGAWETMGVDGSGLEEETYWGGELASDTLAQAVAQALHYQAKWPEGEVRISMGESHEVMRIPPIIQRAANEASR